MKLKTDKAVHLRELATTCTLGLHATEHDPDGSHEDNTYPQSFLHGRLACLSCIGEA